MKKKCRDLQIMRRNQLQSLLLATLLATHALLSQAEETTISAPPGVENPSPADAEEYFQEARRILKKPAPNQTVADAYDLMKKAADLGYADAIGGLGFFYATGNLVNKNEEEAMKYFRLGAEKGGPYAQLNLGRMLAYGKQGAKNETEGFAWIKKAADQNLPDACGVMGDIYFSGEFGQKADYNLAFKYHLQAAEAGNVLSQNVIGVYLRDGIGTPIDNRKALEWFRKAAEQGNAKAESNLGHLIGFEGKDRAEALKWLLLADDQSEVTATHTLEEITPHLPVEDLDKARKLKNAFRAKVVEDIPITPQSPLYIIKG